jgi:hypothetical protein
MRRLFLLGIALMVGPLLILTSLVILGGSLDFPALSEEMGIFALISIAYSFPFFLVALIDRGGFLPWIIGLVLTLGLWGYALYDAMAHPHQGANIGLGLVLTVAPFFITFACVATALRGLSLSRERQGP